MVYWRLLFFLSHTLITITITTAQPNFIFSYCVPNPNNNTTTYEANLKTLLSSFSSTINSYGFYSASHGQKSDRVNAIVLCRGDVELDICRSCVNDSTHKLRQVCQNYTEAIAWYDYCMLSGYMPPEYVMYGQFSVKSDVFSFGVLVLEIISGQKNSHFQKAENAEDLLTYTWKNWKDGRASNVIDPTILKASSNCVQDIMRCIHIGLLCVQENVANRPTMASVVLMLSSFSRTLSLPSQPAFFMHNTINLPESTSLGQDFDSELTQPRSKQSGSSSVNEVSITELYPR